MNVVEAKQRPTQACTVVWLRDDVRLADNPALAWAAQRGRVVVAIIDEHPLPRHCRPLGAAALWWREVSLHSLAQRLLSVGVPVVRLSGHASDELQSLLSHVKDHCGYAEASEFAVVWNRRYEVGLAETDAAVEQALVAQGVTVRSFPGNLLVEPASISTKDGGSYRVFTPYSRAAAEVAEFNTADFVQHLGENAQTPTFSYQQPGDELLHSWSTPVDIDKKWQGVLAQHCVPGEVAADAALEEFIAKLQQRAQRLERGYHEGRDFPAEDITSGLSPYLRHGEISVHRVWQRISAVQRAGSVQAADAETFRKELLWRDFAWHRLVARPDLATRAVREVFEEHFEWTEDAHESDRAGFAPLPLTQTPEQRNATALDPRRITDRDDLLSVQFAAWKSGTTGVPLVDAGMRELWATGTMHNRVRMVVGSFLTKNLLIHWRMGEQWFWDTLVDADPASNPFNWQWVAGCGDDAAPYFRIFNPLTQAEKFDPQGIYRTRWVPESFTPLYPPPIVDLKASRQAALAAYQSARELYGQVGAAHRA
ncbi:MAG: deoxyribodipyrimidine photo-lyase [Corynebacterium sp.]|nr:deoxyribodipyrimidine photo-lyase [Corynebacterium sp.]